MNYLLLIIPFSFAILCLFSNTIRNIVTHNATIAIIAATGVTLVYIELIELRESNNITQEVFKNSYRPIGILIPKEKVGPVKLGDGTFGFESEITIKNRGDGVLIYVGSIIFFSKSNYEFIENNFITLIKFEESLRIGYDTQYDETRYTPVFPNEETTTRVASDTLYANNEDEFMEKYKYLYVVCFYKDIQNNLYDTVLMYGVIEKDRRVTNTLFHSYDQNDVRELERIFNKLGNKSLAMAFQRVYKF